MGSERVICSSRRSARMPSSAAVAADASLLHHVTRVLAGSSASNARSSNAGVL